MPVMARPSMRTSPAEGGELAEDAVEQRRLARAVRPDQAEDLAFAHVEGNAVHGADAAECFVQSIDFENGGHRTSFLARSASPSSPDGQNAISTITAIA